MINLAPGKRARRGTTVTSSILRREELLVAVGLRKPTQGSHRPPPVAAGEKAWWDHCYRRTFTHNFVPLGDHPLVPRPPFRTLVIYHKEVCRPSFSGLVLGYGPKVTLVRGTVDTFFCPQMPSKAPRGWEPGSIPPK